MTEQHFDLGMVGLGTMGSNLALNMGDHGFAVMGYDRELSQVRAFREEANGRDLGGADTVQDFVDALRRPRNIMMLVPAGKPVDSVITALLPHLEADDLLIDGGNSHYPDTDLRSSALAQKGIHYLGVGISGGEYGARTGPSLMPGGPRDAYERVRPIFEAAAAKVNGEPCVTYLGRGSVGHYVKMVHNGIEYGVMQLIAESYDLMKRGLGLDAEELQQIYHRWNDTELNSYLLEITAEIFEHVDETTGRRLIDLILGEAEQTGTGTWTCQDALELQVPVPTLDVAVSMRNLSALEDQRHGASQVLHGPLAAFKGDQDVLVEQLRNALYAGMIITFAQGIAQLGVASQAKQYELQLSEVARIWRGGCIIRAALLDDIRAAYGRQAELANLLLDPALSHEVDERQDSLRAVIHAATDLGVPAPAFSASLGYFDAYRSAWLPANLIQAQRDFFGSHTYERIDQKGVFHTQWQPPYEVSEGNQ